MKKINKRAIFTLVMVAIILVITLISVFLARRQQEIKRSKAALGTATISLVSSKSNVYLNAPDVDRGFDVRIRLDTGGLITTGAGLVLSFDANQLEVTGDTVPDNPADTSTLGIQISVGSVFPSSTVFQNLANNSLGKVYLSVGSLTGTFNGAGDLGTVSFRPKAVGSANLTLSPPPATKVTDLNADNLITSSSQLSPVTVNISNDTIAPSVPTPLQPQVGAYLDTTTPSFDWGDSSDSGTGLGGYNIQVSTDQAFSSPIINTNVTQSSYVVGSPPLGQGSYYWRVRSLDKVVPTPNTSGWSNPGNFIVDTNRPTGVTNLSALAPSDTSTTDSLMLSWSAPNANPGTATSYTIKYSTSTITTSNWGTATTFTAPPIPSNPGTPQSVSISGLQSNTTYYFAIKSRDQVGEGPISNVVSAKTHALPVSLGFKIKLDGITSGPKPNANVNFILRQGSSSFNQQVVLAYNVLDSTFSTPPVPLSVSPGIYSILIKGPSHLRKLIPQTVQLNAGDNQMDWSAANLKILAGDAYNDNVVDIQDFAVLRRDFTKTTSPADFDLDSLVDITDFGLLRKNFGMVGDN